MTRALRPEAQRALLALLALGAVVRVVIAFATEGHAYDIANAHLVGEAFARDPLSVYAVAVAAGSAAGAFDLATWPYPPGYLPVMAGAARLADALGLPFHGIVSLPTIAADLAIAWFAQDFLGRRGAPERARLAAAALVALGPSFIVISGYHAQIDGAAILPGVAAVWAWEVMPVARRALVAGLLIGLGAAIKAVPIVLLVALVPAAESLRERARLVLAPAAVLLVTCGPYLVAETEDFRQALNYSGGPGLGGLTMFLEPRLAQAYLIGTADVPNAVTDWVYRHATLFVAAGLALAGAFVLRHRPRVVEAAALVWLTVLVANPNFFLQYTVWVLPFLVLAGWLREVALLQALLLPVAVLTYGAPWGAGWIVAPYVVLMTAVWGIWGLLLVRSVMRIAADRPTTSPSPR